MILSIALAQIQLPPNYGAAYQNIPPKKLSGAPKSPLRAERAARLMEISLEIGETHVDELLAIFHTEDDRLHRDDCRKILDELVGERKMDKRMVRNGSRSRALYKVRNVEAGGSGGADCSAANYGGQND